MKHFTDEDKLELVERMIERWRKEAREQPLSAGARDWAILKAIATDLRAGKPDVKNRALFALGVQVDVARRARAQLGYIEVGQMQALAEALMAHWPTIQKALSQEPVS